MANIDWDDVDSSFAGKYAGVGTYKVKCTNVTIEEKGVKGNAVAKFEFEGEKDITYPTADHWLTFTEGKEKWRYHHMKELMVVLGATEDAAKKAVQTAESGDKAKIIASYIALFKKLLSKKPTVEIEVYKQFNESNGKEYSRAEFTDGRVAMPHDTTATPQQADTQSTSSANEIELNEAGLNIDDIPF